ncbi:MAG TPA: ABC transporter substrate-binding protein [Rhodothermales bacterium]|nr:ABC transporter substrate-binding protein [Rhodothermales bacterium]
MKKTIVLATAVPLAFCGLSLANAQEPIEVGHLSPHTGPYSHFGPHFDGAIDFTLGLINENPPLGRPMVGVHQDFGTMGEAQAARRLVEIDGVEILFNLAGGYESYRDWIIEHVAANGRPMMPSVHAGSQRQEFGGTPVEPLFRGSPMDTAQATAAAMQAKEAGAQTVVVIGTEDSGMQVAQDTAAVAAKLLGMDVLGEIDIQTEQTSYRSEVAQANSLNPDALLVFAQAEEGGIIVKNAAEMGMSAMFLGEPNWISTDFPQTATMGAIDRHKEVWVVGYTHADSPAWDFFREQWENSEYADLSAAGDSYTMQMYDLLNVTALAIEAAGTTDARVWAEHVRDVAMGPGKVVYTYKEGIEALRNGEEIDYSGVTGEYDYNDTGVVSGLFAVFEWASPTEFSQVKLLDDTDILELNVKVNEQMSQ